MARQLPATRSGAHRDCGGGLPARGWSLVRPDGNVETSLLWRHGSGALCKARPDWFAADRAICVDLKTTLDASRETFMRQLWNLRYDVQAAFYMDGLYSATGILPHSFVWIVVETEAPFGVAIYRMGYADLEVAQADIANGAAKYVECTASGEWPGYSTEVQEIKLPPWARAARRETIQEF